MIPVFFGATLLVYALVFLLPGDPIAALSGQRQLPPGIEAQLRHQYHLDQSFIVQYLIYLKGIVTGDFGTSYSGRPVSEVMAQAFPVTIRLALLALLFEAVFGIGAGLIAGLRRGGIFDASLLVASLIVIAVPIFVIGFVVQIVFGVKLGWINPTVGPEAKWSE
jgi:oligopeptide transport system permease protein